MSEPYWITKVGIAGLPTYERNLIGPRHPGAIVHSMQGGTSRVDAVVVHPDPGVAAPAYEVVIVETDLDGPMRGRRRVHSTSWNERDQTVLVERHDPSIDHTPAGPGPQRTGDEHATIARLTAQVRDAEVGDRREVLASAAFTVGNLVGRGELSYTEGHRALTQAANDYAEKGLYWRDRPIADGMERGIRLAHFDQRREQDRQHEEHKLGVSR